MGKTECTLYSDNSCPSDYIQLKIDFEKQAVQIQQKDKEIQLLHEKINDLSRIIKLLEKTQV